MADRLTALIVDDERLARKELRSLLSVHRDVEVCGEAASLAEAVKLLTGAQPDVIFLDIQMPSESGFELFSRTDVKSRVIFVTAHDAYALRAFEVNALDYLLKPVEPARLAESLARVRAGIETGTSPAVRFEYDDFLFLNIDGRSRFLRLRQIAAITAAGDYTELLTADGDKARVLRPLRAWEDRLPQKEFVRIHRETIVNLRYVDRIEEWFKDSFQVHLRGAGAPFTLSRRYASRLKARF